MFVFAWRAYRRLAEQADETHRRLEATLAALNVRLAENSDVIERNVRVIERFESTESRLWDAIDDMRDAIQANTQALLRLIDRLDNGQQPA